MADSAWSISFLDGEGAIGSSVTTGDSRVHSSRWNVVEGRGCVRVELVIHFISDEPNA